MVVAGTGVVAALATFIVRHQQEQPIASVMQSSILAEQRTMLVHLPESYEKEAAWRYPVLYVLDGSSQSIQTARSARAMARNGAMPEMIVVGVPNTSGQGRERDYTPPYMRLDPEKEDGPKGEADRFLQFFANELIPHVEGAFRTTSTRMLAGNSRGGLFVVYSLIEKPELFNARFAYSAPVWREDGRMVAELARSLPSRVAAPTFLYLSVGDGETERMTRGFRMAAEVMRQSAPPAFRWRADITKGAVHGNNAALSTPVALQEYYRVHPAPREGSPHGRSTALEQDP